MESLGESTKERLFLANPLFATFESEEEFTLEIKELNEAVDELNTTS